MGGCGTTSDCGSTERQGRRMDTQVEQVIFQTEMSTFDL